MQSHVRILAVLHIVFACLGILIGLGLFVMFGGLAALVAANEGGSDAFAGMAVLGGIGTFLLVLLLVLSLPGLVAGVALLNLKPWGKILGIYGLWVLVNPETDRLFNIAQPAVRAT